MLPTQWHTYNGVRCVRVIRLHGQSWLIGCIEQELNSLCDTIQPESVPNTYLCMITRSGRVALRGRGRGGAARLHLLRPWCFLVVVLPVLAIARHPRAGLLA